ncbi:hypothetical protein Asulf_01480 [Archaeoglobus sulfaticallidus PM70-1]|uniref:Uncharacterized protein n=1 Tax=Archaeoglobus sulfaticallidus PM70-1 TaxID=387631 RepID=N0BEN0_9EURY|nr:DUF790 family protein [Archaeoglobus sulfaticallidus]AGK61463.1 hypothetical protein Asulf_01480 [Archaeoglobus sulfaticallidus PM70-1]
MLPKEYLDVRKIKGKIYPRFVDFEWFDIAKKVISIYAKNTGNKLKKARNEVKKIEDSENYKKIRAFARIVEREIDFKSPTTLNPLEVRKLLFSKGPVTTASEREKVIEEVARRFGVDKREIELSMFGDMEEDSIIDGVKVDPETLLMKYNLSLLQTTLMNAIAVRFRVEDNHKKVFSGIKRLGLMYEIEDEFVRLTGPASILKQTKKYGTAFAKLIPAIVNSRLWVIHAEILDYDRIYRMSISSEDGVMFYREKLSMDFDSSLEEELYSRLICSRRDLEIVREPSLVSVGGFAFIPDFRIRRGDREIYIEIAGFWTEDYVKKKVEKIERANIPLLVVAREEIAEKLKSRHVIRFKNKLPYLKILKFINEYFADSGGKNIMKAEGEVPEKYLRYKDWFVSIDFIEYCKKCIEEGRVEEVVEKEGGSIALEYLGYKVVWDGLSDFRIVRVHDD